MDEVPLLFEDVKRFLCISFIYQAFFLEEMHLTGTGNGWKSQTLKRRKLRSSRKSKKHSNYQLNSFSINTLQKRHIAGQ